MIEPPETELGKFECKRVNYAVTMWRVDGMPAFRPTWFKVSHSGLGKRENYTAGRCSKSGILKFISLLAIHPLRERHSCLGCFSSTVILSRNQRRNRHKNKNVAKAQINAQDISGGIEMVKMKTNEPIAKKKRGTSKLTANPPLCSGHKYTCRGRSPALNMQLEEMELLQRCRS